MRPTNPRPPRSRGRPRSPAPRRRPRLLAHREQRQIHLETIGRSNPAPFSGSRLVVGAGGGVRDASDRRGWKTAAARPETRAPSSRVSTTPPPRPQSPPKKAGDLRRSARARPASSAGAQSPGCPPKRTGPAFYPLGARGRPSARGFRHVGPAEGAGGRGGATGGWSGARRGERRTRPESRAIMNAQHRTPPMFDIVAEWLRRQT